MTLQLETGLETTGEFTMFNSVNFNSRWLITILAVFCCVAGTVTVQAAEPLNIIVYGASGRIGSRIVAEALNRGHHVTGVSRDPARLSVNHPNFTAIKGDVTDAELVAKQIAGRDAVVSSVGRSKAATPEQAIEYRAAVSLISALYSLGFNAPRVIFVGGASTLQDQPGETMVDGMIRENRLPPGDFGAMIVAHMKVLEMLRATSDIRWTVLTPPMQITPGRRTGKFRLGGNLLLRDTDGKSAISMEDFAAALVDELENPRHTGKRFTVAY